MSRSSPKVVALVCALIPILSQANAYAPVWESWEPVLQPESYGQLYENERRQYMPARQGNLLQYQTVAYSRYQPERTSVDCALAHALNLPDGCIRRDDKTRQGLLTQARYLGKQSRYSTVAPLWGNISNLALQETVQELLDWHDGLSPGSLQDRFSLREVGSGQRPEANFTGYFTPLVEVRTHPDSQFRIPIYKAPPGHLKKLTHGEIARNALGGKGLEIAWTNDPINLFYAQVQGSGIARFPDGKEMMLDYAADNGQPFRSIADYMRMRGYKPRSYGNEAVREWLRAHPEKVGEILTHNPRYVFFKLTADLPKTASGTSVIPGHTIAVDSQYIPLGAVLLAEVPRIDSRGNKVGSDWRLLFAQDQGVRIKGPGRLDLYTGFGRQAEELAHGITGYNKTWMLVRKPGYGRRANVAGL